MAFVLCRVGVGAIGMDGRVGKGMGGGLVILVVSAIFTLHLQCKIKEKEMPRYYVLIKKSLKQ